MQTNSSPIEVAALYALGYMPSESMPKLATRWLVEGLDTPSMRLLAGETNPIMSDVAPLFEAVLQELAIDLPNKREAALTLLEAYLRQMVSGALDPYEGMALIDSQLNQPDIAPATKYVGDGLGIERLFTWYRELQDAEDGSTLFYYTDLPVEESVVRFREHLIEEARLRLDDFEAASDQTQ